MKKGLSDGDIFADGWSDDMPWDILDRALQQAYEQNEITFGLSTRLESLQKSFYGLGVPIRKIPYDVQRLLLQRGIPVPTHDVRLDHFIIALWRFGTSVGREKGEKPPIYSWAAIVIILYEILRDGGYIDTVAI